MLKPDDFRDWKIPDGFTRGLRVVTKLELFRSRVISDVLIVTGREDKDTIIKDVQNDNREHLWDGIYGEILRSMYGLRQVVRYNMPLTSNFDEVEKSFNEILNKLQHSNARRKP